MRTTLSLDDDVLAFARAQAERQKKSLGDVISALARQSIRRDDVQDVWNGIPQLPVRDKRVVVTMEMVNRLRDELP